MVNDMVDFAGPFLLGCIAVLLVFAVFSVSWQAIDRDVLDDLCVERFDGTYDFAYADEVNGIVCEQSRSAQLVGSGVIKSKSPLQGVD